MSLEYDIVLHDGAAPLLLEGRPTDPESCILLQSVEGLDGRELREEVLELPDRDGDYLGGLRAAGLGLILSGKIIGLDRTDLRARERSLRAAVGSSPQTWQMRVTGRVGDPEDLIAAVRPSQGLRCADGVEGPGRVKEWQVSLRSGAPVLYGANQLTASVLPMTGTSGLSFPLTFPLAFGAGASTSIQVTNAGDAPTPPALRVYGPITQPIIENLTTGQQIAVVGSLGDGDWIDIDVATRRVTYASGASAYPLIDRAASSFWVLPPGASTISLRASAFSGVARLVVTHRNAYL